MKKNLDSECKMLADIAEEDKVDFHVLIKNPIVSISVACLLGQQAVEKYMKSVLSEKRVPFPFTHDLLKLHALLIKNGLEIPIPLEELKKLNPFAVKQRYDRPPEVYLTRDEAKYIVDTVTNWCKGQIDE